MTRRLYSPVWSLLLGFVLLLVCVLISLTFGARNIAFNRIIAAFTNYDDSIEHVVVLSMRLPRALIAVMVGANLAVAGALMQGLTHNPLASPSLLGINAGAALAVVTAVFVFGASSSLINVFVAFIGAAIASVTVYVLGSLGRTGATPINLMLAGAAMTALFSSLTTGILIVSERSLEEIRFWLAGSISGRDINLFFTILPITIIGLFAAFGLGRQINVLSLGEDVAIGLGEKTLQIKIATVITVVLLAGSAVAVAGPISFVGLIVPHIARKLVRHDYRWILPTSAILGGILLLLSDLAARLIVRPQELPVGVMTALVGGTFFLYLLKK